MRCLALGQAWKSLGGDVAFITACSADWLLDRLDGERFVVRRLATSSDPAAWDVITATMEEQPNAFLVFDGYQYTLADQRHAKQSGYRLLVIDDLAQLPQYCADVILNSSRVAGQLDYRCERATQCLFGTRFVLLRREFLEWRDWTRAVSRVAGRVLVVMGGTDPLDITPRVLHGLGQLDVPLEILVTGRSETSVYGRQPANSPIDGSVRARRGRHAARHRVGRRRRIRRRQHLLGAGVHGSSRDRHRTSRHQRWVADTVVRGGAAISAGGHSALKCEDLAAAAARLVHDSAARRAMRDRGRELVDGEGARRVASVCWQYLQQTA